MKFMFWMTLFVCVFIALGAAVVCMFYARGTLHELVLTRVILYCEKNLNIKLSVESVKGDLFKSLFLENVRIEKIKGLPEDFYASAKSIRFRYSLRQFIEKKPELEIIGLELHYGSLRVPVKFSRQGDQVTLRFESFYLFLEQLEKYVILPRDLFLSGLCEFKGKFTLVGLKIKSVDISVETDAFEMSYGDLEKLKARFELNLKGEYAAPHLTGTVNVVLAEYTGAWDMKQTPLPSWPDAAKGWLVDILLKGNNIKVLNKTVDAAMKAELKLRKAASDMPHLSGKAEVYKGSYAAYQNRFKITKGEILFPEDPASPIRLNIDAETKVRGYRIFASTRGTIGDSSLELTSDPRLSKDQVVSLLLFGRRLEDLSSQDRKAFLDSGKVTESLLDKLFLGKVEAGAAKMIHVDDLSVRMDMNGGLQQMPSVQVGKYVDGDKFYGTYQVKPPSAIGGQMNQTVAGEYRVTESMAIEGARSLGLTAKSPSEDKLQVKFHWNF